MSTKIEEMKAKLQEYIDNTSVEDLKAEAAKRNWNLQEDLEAGAYYFKLETGKIAKTVAKELTDGITVAVDLDSNGRALGVEIIGIKS